MSRLEWLKDTSGRVVETLRQIIVAQGEFERGSQQLGGDDRDAIVHVSVKPATDTEVTIRVTGNEDAKKERNSTIAELQFATSEILKNLQAVELTSCELDIDLQNLAGGLSNADDAAKELVAAIAGLFEGVKKLDGQIQLVAADGDAGKADDAKMTAQEVLASADQIYQKSQEFAKLLAALMTKSPPFVVSDNAQGETSDTKASSGDAPGTEAQSAGAEAG